MSDQQHEPDSFPLPWDKERRYTDTELWSRNVMKDQRCSTTALRVAWDLTFYFNSDTGLAWPTKALIAKGIGMTESSVSRGLAELESFEHIERKYKTVDGKPRRFMVPCFNQKVQHQPARVRKGGVQKGVDPKFRSLERVGSDPHRDE